MSGLRVSVGKVIFITVVIASCLTPVRSSAQFADAGINFDVGAPQGKFRDNLDRNGYGGSISGVIHPGGSILGLGVELGILNYGHESRTEPLSTTIPDVRVRVSNTNNFINGHLFLRLRQRFGALEPYADGLVGFNYLYTESKIENLRGDEDIASSVNLDDGTFSYGIGGGVMIRLADIDIDDPNIQKLGISLDFKVRYLRGGNAEYLKEGSISRENGNILYDVQKSRTDMILYQFGVMANF